MERQVTKNPESKENVFVRVFSLQCPREPLEGLEALSHLGCDSGFLVLCKTGLPKEVNACTVNEGQ